MSSQGETSRIRELEQDGPDFQPLSMKTKRMVKRSKAKQNKDAYVTNLQVELVQAESDATENYNNQKQWEKFARKQKRKQKQFQRIVTKHQSTVKDQRDLMKSRDNKRKLMGDRSTKSDDLKKVTFEIDSGLMNQELKIRQMIELSGQQAEEIVHLKMKVKELSTSVMAKDKAILNGNKINEDLREQNTYLKDYIYMKDQEIVFLKSKRKDLFASKLGANIKDLEVSGPPQPQRIKLVDPSELLVYSQYSGNMEDNIAEVERAEDCGIVEADLVI